MNNEEMGNRKRCDQLNYRDWNYKACYKKAHNIHGRFSLNQWIDYVFECVNHYKDLYTLGYNRGFIEIGEKGGAPYVMAREADRRL